MYIKITSVSQIASPKKRSKQKMCKIQYGILDLQLTVREEKVRKLEQAEIALKQQDILIYKQRADIKILEEERQM